MCAIKMLHVPRNMMYRVLPYITPYPTSRANRFSLHIMDILFAIHNSVHLSTLQRYSCNAFDG